MLIVVINLQQVIVNDSNNIFIYMEEELDLELWFDDESLFDIGLDEYLSKLFNDTVEEQKESNINNYAEYNYQ